MNNEKFYFSKENDKWLLNFLDNRKFEISDKEKILLVNYMLKRFQ